MQMKKKQVNPMSYITGTEAGGKVRKTSTPYSTFLFITEKNTVETPQTTFVVASSRTTKLNTKISVV
jgi:hypothetical protein